MYKIRYKHILRNNGDPRWQDLDLFLQKALDSKNIKPYKTLGNQLYKNPFIDLPLSENLIFTIKGLTICTIEDSNRNILASGYSVCSSKDNFNRKIGRSIAKQRAFKNLPKE